MRAVVGEAGADRVLARRPCMGHILSRNQPSDEAGTVHGPSLVALVFSTLLRAGRPGCCNPEGMREAIGGSTTSLADGMALSDGTADKHRETSRTDHRRPPEPKATGSNPGGRANVFEHLEYSA